MGRMSDGALPLPPSFGGPLFWSDKGENPGQETWRIEFDFYSQSALLKPLISASAICCFPLQFQDNREYLQSRKRSRKPTAADRGSRPKSVSKKPVFVARIPSCSDQ